MGNTSLRTLNEGWLSIRSPLATLGPESVNFKPEDIKVGTVFYFSDDHSHWSDPKDRWLSILRFEVTRFYLDPRVVNTVCPKMRVCFREAGRPNGMGGEVAMRLSGLKNWMRPDPSPTVVVFKCLRLLPEHEREVIEYFVLFRKPETQ